MPGLYTNNNIGGGAESGKEKERLRKVKPQKGNTGYPKIK